MHKLCLNFLFVFVHFAQIRSRSGGAAADEKQKGRSLVPLALMLVPQALNLFSLGFCPARVKPCPHFAFGFTLLLLLVLLCHSTTPSREKAVDGYQFFAVNQPIMVLFTRVEEGNGVATFKTVVADDVLFHGLNKHLVYLSLIWYYYYSILFSICQVVFEKFFIFFNNYFAVRASVFSCWI